MIILRPLIKRVLLIEEVIGFIIYISILVLLTIAHIWRDNISEATKYFFFGNLIIFLIIVQFGIFIIFLIVNGCQAIKNILNNYKTDIVADENVSDAIEKQNLLEKKEENIGKVAPKTHAVDIKETEQASGGENRVLRMGNTIQHLKKSNFESNQTEENLITMENPNPTSS